MGNRFRVTPSGVGDSSGKTIPISPCREEWKSTCLRRMVRISRVVAPGYPHHVTQRGVRSISIFSTDQDRRAYLAILAGQLDRFSVEVLAWCLMTNHTHLIVVPKDAAVLAQKQLLKIDPAGRPAGSDHFVKLKILTRRDLHLRKAGRPLKVAS
jgi:hypothetical protein